MREAQGDRDRCKKDTRTQNRDTEEEIGRVKEKEQGYTVTGIVISVNKKRFKRLKKGESE